RTAPVAVSAVTGKGIDDLMALIEERVAGRIAETSVTLSPNQMSLMDWVYRHGEVTDRENHEDGSITIRIRATDAARDEIRRRLSSDNRG
ncbi:hypothetical protein M8745_20810, partial [Lutimaribacter sp. EGI FJ00014]|nr:hypothetical protein [Lutimaribacter sp. EGI FJ00014]